MASSVFLHPIPTVRHCRRVIKAPMGHAAGVTPVWAWDQASLHLKNGNIGLADGSVQQCTISGLQSALTAATNGEPNLNPYYNFPQ